MAKVRGSRLGRVADRIVNFFSGEWILEWSPYTANGGTVVAVRSLWLTFWVFLPAFLLKTTLGEGKVAVFDVRQGAADFVEILPWLAAVFAGVYVALYTRFSSQWTYLANLFNQIVQAQLALPETPHEAQLTTMASWKAAFIEDAEDLHLAAKPMFLVAVQDWGSDPRVASRFVRNTVGGERRLTGLLKRLEIIREKAEEAAPTALAEGAVPERESSVVRPKSV
jgi:hypothetical protein